MLIGLPKVACLLLFTYYFLCRSQQIAQRQSFQSAQAQQQLLSLKHATPKRIAYTPPPRRGSNYTPLIVTLAGKQPVQQTLNYAASTQIKSQRLVAPPKPTPLPLSSLSPKNMQQLRELDDRSLDLEGYLKYPLAYLASLRTKEGEKLKNWIKQHARTLYDYLMVAKGVNNYAYFKYLIANELNILIQDVEDIQRVIEKDGKKTQMPVTIVGDNNTVDRDFSRGREFISVVGNNNDVYGNEIVTGGNSITTLGRNLFLYGNNVNVTGQDTVIIGHNDKNFNMSNKLILGNFFLDIWRYKNGYDYIQYVEPGADYRAVPFE